MTSSHYFILKKKKILKHSPEASRLGCRDFTGYLAALVKKCSKETLTAPGSFLLARAGAACHRDEPFKGH